MRVYDVKKKVTTHHSTFKLTEEPINLLYFQAPVFVVVVSTENIYFLLNMQGNICIWIYNIHL